MRTIMTAAPQSPPAKHSGEERGVPVLACAKIEWEANIITSDFPPLLLKAFH